MVQRKTSKSTTSGTSHYHFSTATDRLGQHSHSGGHSRHLHASRGLRGYGRTRASFTPL
ncbi:hypothetical protein LCGC14_0567670 [marine sediment metagenome]|uniref:Uncharacterized protein n=1 Tax=marine sediment metagenome TaxID=412755 RepID=A0A0F9RQF2_9ZZZZ